MIKDCKMRHKNGNCLPAGGFCIANRNLCEALQNAYRMGQEKRDLELWNAITTAIHLCGLNGEDVTAMSLETLRQLGRYDLLPPCER